MMRTQLRETRVLRAAAYIRVSMIMEDQEDSFENQKAHFEELLSKNNQYESAGIYSDYGISGTSIRNRLDGEHTPACRRGLHHDRALHKNKKRILGRNRDSGDQVQRKLSLTAARKRAVFLL